MCINYHCERQWYVAPYCSRTCYRLSSSLSLITLCATANKNVFQRATRAEEHPHTAKAPQRANTLPTANSHQLQTLAFVVRSAIRSMFGLHKKIIAKRLI